MSRQRIVVGGYNEAPAGRRALGEGVSLLGFDPESGALELLDLHRGLINPSYLRPHRDVVHVVCENDPARSSLVTLGVDGDRLVPLATAPTPGDAPCHVDVDPSGRWAASACYGSGHVIVHALDSRGLASGPVATRLHRGSSINERRQVGPHAHGGCFTADGRWLLVTDLGTDEIWCHALDSATGAIDEGAQRWKAPAGSGPRLMVATRDGRFVVMVTELANTVHSLRVEDGRLTEVGSASTLIDGYTGVSTSAALRWHPSGTAFATSNRGAESVALFRFDPESGAITPLVEASCGGAKPRDIEFSPCGRWLLVCNQDSDEIALLRVDAVKGTVVDSGLRQKVMTPSCVRFLPS